MANKVLITFIAVDVVFLLLGCLMLATAIVFMPNGLTMNIMNDAALDMLLQNSPLNVVIANAVFVFTAFLLSIPAIISQKATLLRVFTYAVVLCAVLTLAVGLTIWFSTLQTHANLSNVWVVTPPMQQSKIQNLFNCCGYTNLTTPITFVQDNVCTDPATAQRLGGCANPFSSYANNVLDIVFTAMFGIAGVDAIMFLAGVVLLKARAEKERYKLIDQKIGAGGI